MSAILAYKKHGVAPKILHHLLLNHFTFPEQYQDTLSNYYLIYWSPEYLFRNLVEGTINHRNIEYLVVYHNCTPASLKNYTQIKLSFRRPAPEYNIPSYVLITPNFYYEQN